MSLHVFANIVTCHGVASNNRGDVEGGNIATLQKLIWHGETHTSVSAEAIRFALRRRLEESHPGVLNRHWDEKRQKNQWRDSDFKNWHAERDNAKYVDDDLLGFMLAEGGREEGTLARRSVLEVSRAMSLTPWDGDVHSGYASPNATPSAQKKGEYSTPYTAEIHATRYQYGLAMTPGQLRDPSRAAVALRSLAALGEVAGNHGRFLFDFSPESIILRLTDDPAPRLLYCFVTEDGAKSVGVTDEFRSRVGENGADIRGDELIIGGAFAATKAAKELESVGATLFPHQVKAAVEEACKRIAKHPDVKGK